MQRVERNFDSTKTLHIATLNVHGAYGKLRRGLGDEFRPLELDVICLQECSAGTADAFCSMLGPSWRAVVAPAAYLANAILSPHPVRKKKAITLSEPDAEVRSAALAQIAFGEKNDLWICSTHLDHRSESIRLAQWDTLHKELPAEHLLCGDLNALTKTDYDAQTWNEIADVRVRNHWEAPLHDLMDRLDCLGYQESWKHAGNNGRPPMTSRFETRIDYVLASRNFPARFVPQSHAWVDTRHKDLTDHALVHVQLYV